MNKTNMTQAQIFDIANQEMQNAYDLIAKTNKSFFLTGRAGTGKTTFLKNVQKEINKNFSIGTITQQRLVLPCLSFSRKNTAMKSLLKI